MSKQKIDFLLDALVLAAEYHDIGKLSRQPQSILANESPAESEQKMLNHVDAGVALMLRMHRETKNAAYLMAAIFIHGHHIGLENFDNLIKLELDKTSKVVKNCYSPKEIKFRDNRDVYDTYKIAQQGMKVKEYVDDELRNLLNIHDNEVDVSYTLTANSSEFPRLLNAVEIRFAFSCFVDADHTDTELFYTRRKNYLYKYRKLEPEKRIECLNRYIDNLPIDSGTSDERLQMRKLLQKICRETTPSDELFSVLDATVGTGKTFASIMYGLRLAELCNCDRLNFIIPYTNIISQTVAVLRDSVVLPKEDEENVNEIHSKCEFEKAWMRKYSSKWNAPMNVSTSVQFFDSFFSNMPSAVRKLHWFANSVTVFDEFDKAMNPYDWKFAIAPLRDAAQSFNMRYILSSGTSVYFWDIFDVNIDYSNIVDKKTYRKMLKMEKKRCKIKRMRGSIKNPNRLIKHAIKAMKSNNGGMFVMNTNKNAARMACIFRENKHFENYEIYELHGWMTPNDKEVALKKLKTDLKNSNKKILLFATSTIECGVDLSFDVGWREYAPASNVFQCTGRINRGLKVDGAICYVFYFDQQLVEDKVFSENPEFLSGGRILLEADSKNLTPNKCTEFMQLEIESKDSTETARNADILVQKEKELAFRYVGENFRVIDSFTGTIIIDKSIVAKMQEGEDVRHIEIARSSVQIRMNRIERIMEDYGRQYITKMDEDGYYAWNGEYDSTSGISKAMLAIT